MNKSLNPKKLVQRLSEKSGADPGDTGFLIDELFSIITEEVRTTGRMSLFGFGSFSAVPVKESTRRNPRTGEPLIIPAHLRIKFSPASALAERINAEYADLEPVIIENEAPEGLLVKASRYREEAFADQPDIDQPVEVPPPPPPPPVTPDEPEKPNGRKRVFAALVSLAGLLILLSLFLAFGSSGDRSEPAPSVVEVPEKPVTPPSAPPSRPRVSLTESYEITPGDTFSILARERWGQIELWPYLYNLNKHQFPDPDFLHPGDTILIPPRPEVDRQKEEIEFSIMTAYDRYRTLIYAQKGNPRNSNRLRSVHNVLSGGRELYPDFIERYRNEIRPEDIP